MMYSFGAGPPWCAHYLIHACDNPVLATQAPAAARRYAQIAPASPRAVHMSSHIFARLGMWDEDIKSNIRQLLQVSMANSMKFGRPAMRTSLTRWLENGTKLTLG